MFFLPITPSPGEHGAEDHTGGAIAQARRSFRQQVHMGVDGFIACALLIQGLSAAGVIPAQVWVAEPGYALLVCVGMVTVSASILFSLKSLLTQAPRDTAHQDDPNPMPQQGLGPQISKTYSLEPVAAPVALVIQESRTTQTIIERSLAKAGITTVCVSDEVAARQALQAGTFELLIVGTASGASARSSTLEDLCGVCRGNGIPVLALAIDKAVDAPEFGADAILQVPIIPDDLARVAKQLIARPVDGAETTFREAPATPRPGSPKLLAEPLDARALADLERLGGRDFVRDIVAQFVADAALVLASLAAAVAERDQKAFREQAHALRSCAANVGAQNVYSMCLAWRDLDAQEIAASGVQCMKMLEEEFERVRDALTPMLQDEAEGTSGDAA